MKHNFYANVQQIELEVSVKKLIHAKRIRVLGMTRFWRTHTNPTILCLLIVFRNSTCYRIDDFMYKCVCDQVHTGKNCQSR